MGEHTSVQVGARTSRLRHRPIGDTDDGASFGDLFAAETPPPEEELEVSFRTDALRRAIAELPDRQQGVLKLRFGLDGDPNPMSLEQIGKTLGITRERVRQIELQALERLALDRELDALRAA